MPSSKPLAHSLALYQFFTYQLQLNTNLSHLPSSNPDRPFSIVPFSYLLLGGPSLYKLSLHIGLSSLDLLKLSLLCKDLMPPKGPWKPLTLNTSLALPAASITFSLIPLLALFYMAQ